MRVFVWLAYKNEHLNLYVGNVLERKTCMNNKKWMDSSTDRGSERQGGLAEIAGIGQPNSWNSQLRITRMGGR